MEPESTKVHLCNTCQINNVPECLSKYQIKFGDGVADDNIIECTGYSPVIENTLTCVYCGMQYPKGTPPSGAEILTDHIKVCPKHPLREAEEKIERLRKALSDIIGTEKKEELEAMEATVRAAITMSSVPSTDGAHMINAIHVLIETEDTFLKDEKATK